MNFLRTKPGWVSIALLAGGTAAMVTTAMVWRSVSLRPAMLATMVQAGYSTLDEVSWAEIERLRAESHLDNDALGCMDLSAGELETVLAALRSWYETHAVQLRSRRSGLGNAAALVRHHASEIKQGRSDVVELATARGELASMEARYATLIAAAQTQALVSLTTAQRTMFDIAKANADLAMPYRALSLNTAQAGAVKAARSGYFRAISVRRDPEDPDRAVLRAAYEQDISDAIGASNATQLATIQGYLGSASVRVVTALDLVLPFEEEEE